MHVREPLPSPSQRRRDEKVNGEGAGTVDGVQTTNALSLPQTIPALASPSPDGNARNLTQAA